jgi:hypothetical protein
MAALNEHIALSQKALIDRKQLLHKIHSECSELAEPAGDTAGGHDASDR